MSKKEIKFIDKIIKDYQRNNAHDEKMLKLNFDEIYGGYGVFMTKQLKKHIQKRTTLIKMLERIKMKVLIYDLEHNAKWVRVKKSKKEKAAIIPVSEDDLKNAEEFYNENRTE